jgi:hypothetical protein
MTNKLYFVKYRAKKDDASVTKGGEWKRHDGLL